MFVGVTLGVIALLYVLSGVRDPTRTRRAARRALTHLGAVGSQLIAILLAVALAAPLLKHAPTGSLLSRAHGPLAIVAAAALGALSSGGPVLAYPVAGALFHYGAGVPASVTAAFLTAWTSVSVLGLPLEAAALGRSFALVRNTIAFAFSCAAGALVGLLY